MTTKRAMKGYECYLCHKSIQKGDQYARKAFRMGEVGTAYDGKNIHKWEPYRPQMPICAKCANPTPDIAGHNELAKTYANLIEKGRKLGRGAGSL